VAEVFRDLASVQVGELYSGTITEVSRSGLEVALDGFPGLLGMIGSLC
jgi:ribosomal protein S1